MASLIAMTALSASQPRIGVYICAISGQRILCQERADEMFIPASTMKCVTAASCMLTLPEDFRFVTDISIHGTVNGEGHLAGNIVVHPSGDPTLGSRHNENYGSLPDRVATWISGMGIKSADAIVVDNSGFNGWNISPYWLMEDIPWEYGAGCFPVNYRDNSVKMTYDLDADSADIDPDILDVISYLRRGTKTDVSAERGPFDNLLVLRGALKGHRFTSRYSVPDPAAMLINDITATLAGYGVEILQTEDNPDIAGPAISSISWRSAMRDDILTSLMHRSDNMYAESMLRTLDPLTHDADTALEYERKLWAARDIDIDALRWVDGCGLAPVNRMSPRQLGNILMSMANNRDYVALFPKAGREGSVKRLLAKTRLEGKLVVKSGSMNGVLCYAGYRVDNAGKPTHVVVIMANGFNCSTSVMRSQLAKRLLGFDL